MLVHSLFTYFVWHSRHHHELISHCVDIINVKLRDPSVQTGVEQIHKVDQRFDGISLLLWFLYCGPSDSFS